VKEAELDRIHSTWRKMPHGRLARQDRTDTDAIKLSLFHLFGGIHRDQFARLDDDFIRQGVGDGIDRDAADNALSIASIVSSPEESVPIETPIIVPQSSLRRPHHWRHPQDAASDIQHPRF